ncbi:MAG TPA: hypothetical protein VH280_19845 [Verrucomicrobiae bacterium]|jgi:hypothetical protein|nr:hypothetical protein [Verrucomicrobiae bacterium]
MQIITIQDFDGPALAWARNQFDQEIQSDFQRTRQFDGSRAKEHLALLRRQSPEQLAILARVLPLGVFWQTPDAHEKRSQLSAEERTAVEKLIADYNSEKYGSFQKLLQKKWDHRRNPEHGKLIKELVKDGRKIHREIGEQKDLELATSGPGEWGLIGRRNWGRFVISINLGGAPSLSYRMGLYNATGDRIRFYDHYLMALGIGAGAWSVRDRSELSEKFLRAVDFATWHANEYEVIINRILEGRQQ